MRDGGKDEIGVKPKQFRLGFGQNFVLVSVFRLSPFLVIRPKYFFGQDGLFWLLNQEKSCFVQAFFAETYIFGRNCLFRRKNVLA